MEIPPESASVNDWPHSPVHRLGQRGAFMLTCGTYQKRAFFNTEKRLSLLLNSIGGLTARYDLSLQAWAVFPNHYHLIVQALQPANIKRFTRHLHSATAITINRQDHEQARKVWFQYWETHLTFQRSYLARLNYVHQNPVKHRVVRVASAYPWCSAAWFERKASRAFFRTVANFPCDKLEIPDEFEVGPPLSPIETLPASVTP